MKKHRITKSVLKKLHGKKGKRTAQTIEKVEKKVRSSLLSQAQALALEICEVERELMALPHRVSKQWLWLGSVKRAGYMMEEVIEILNGPEIVTKDAGGHGSRTGQAETSPAEQISLGLNRM